MSAMKLSQEQFQSLAMQKIDALYRFARKLTRDSLAAEDLVQETFLRALRAWESFNLEEFGILPWLLRIMRNVHITRSQRETRQPKAMDDLASISPTAATVAPIAQGDFAALLDSMDGRVAAALNELQSEYQQVLLLWSIEELSYKEISAALEIPIGTVMSRLHRARQRLAEQLQEFAKEERIIRE